MGTTQGKFRLVGCVGCTQQGSLDGSLTIAERVLARPALDARMVIPLV